MNLQTYFEKTKGTGVLATADGKGKVDAAVYSRPHVKGARKVAFIMKDRLSYRNVCRNPKAAYLFMEEGSDTKGRRLYLSMTGEEKDPDVVARHHRRRKPLPAGETLHLVYFRVTKVRALVGDREYKL